MAINGLNIGASGLQAFQRGLDVSAHNVANALTNNFRPQQAQFQEGSPNGVVVTISQSGSQLANAVNNTGNNGTTNPNNAPNNNTANLNNANILQTSGTDLNTEIVNQIQYQAGFNFSARIVQTNDEILGTLVNLKA